MSMLKVWKVQKARDQPDPKNKLRITCPHCKTYCIVDRKWGDPLRTTGADGKKHLTVGRPCPYCFKTSQLPEQAPGGRPRA